MSKANAIKKTEEQVKTQTLKVPKKKQQLYTGINSVFGCVALFAFFYACFLGYQLLALDLDIHVYDSLLQRFIKSLYYPIFFLIGFIMSRRAFMTKRFQTGIWLAFIIPLMPVLLLALSVN